MEYKDIIAFTLQYEGGKVDDHRDPGGRTAFGITQSTYNAYLLSKGRQMADVWKISQSEVADIYYTRYWIAAGCNYIDDIKLAASFFDFAVNAGVSRSLRNLTISNNDNKLFNQNRKAYYNKIVSLNPKLNVYFKGLMNRVNALEALLQ
jgi:lysozyme family protein